MKTAERPAPGAPRPYNFPDFEIGELDCGARLIVCHVPKLPLATLMAITDSGSATDPEGLEGTATLTAKLLVEGTRRCTGSELSEKLEKLGTSIETGADWDSSIARVTFLTEHFDEVAALLGDSLLGPTFPERELQRLKSERVADLLQIESEPRALADEAFESFLYSAKSRFAIQSGGSTETVPRISRENVLSFFSSAYTSESMTFIATGDVAFEEVRQKLSLHFAALSRGGVKPAARENEIAAESRRMCLLDKDDASQSELRVGHAGLPRSHPDYFPAVVLNAILGGLFGSRINLNLREAHGYTYGASSYFDWRKDVGPFVISTAVATEVTAAALEEILFEIDKIRSEPVTEAELSLAKDYLDGVFPIRYETTASVAAALANVVVHGLPWSYYDTYRARIRSISASQVMEAAQRHLRPERLQTTIVGNVSAISGPIARLGLGPIETKKR